MNHLPHLVEVKFKPIPNFKLEASVKKITTVESLRNFMLDVSAENISRGKSKKIRVIVCAQSAGEQDSITRSLNQLQVVAVSIENISQIADIAPQKVIIANASIKSGFHLQDHVFIPAAAIFERPAKHKQTQVQKTQALLSDINNIKVGDIVVHKNHGIGVFDGLETITVQNIGHECARISYLGGDKLYVPVENLNLISQYNKSSEESSVQLDKLGSSGWQKRNAQARKNIFEIADKLVKVAAIRQMKKAQVFYAQGQKWESFVEAFEHVETPDQERAISDIIQDLQSGKPMDRLVCGDVGFGKTEVAMRAAFIVAKDKEVSDKCQQVVLICPTTLLCRQHTKTFMKRFADFGVKVASLSRLSSKKQRDETLANLQGGEVDILIATHAALSENVSFNNLQLIIIDEEQSFGVKQKERLKSLSPNAHIVTLSATPIPRTLQMSLFGIKDLSIITTPPVQRLPIKTVITKFSKILLREAILREHNRGGNCYYVCPFIADLEDHAKILKETVPELEFRIAHGKLSANELDVIMNDFLDGKFQILLSTTIIAAGIDMPNANTIIIYNPENFGLSSLYQIRGRVGRRQTQGYAYMLTKASNKITDNAYRRLEILQNLQELGVGLSIASHDMDIRGGGNLLGQEQSGDIKEIGVELYQEMLTQQLEEITSKDLEQGLQDLSAPEIKIGIPVFISQDYISDESLRIDMYRKIAAVKDVQGLQDVRENMLDRFGPVPQELSNLLETVELRCICSKAGIKKLEVGEKGINIEFCPHIKAKHGEKILNFAMANPQKMKIKSDEKVVFFGDFGVANRKLEAVKRAVTFVKENVISA